MYSCVCPHIYPFIHPSIHQISHASAVTLDILLHTFHGIWKRKGNYDLVTPTMHLYCNC